MAKGRAFKDSVRRVDQRVLGGRVRRWWLRNMVLGGGWGDFVDEVRAVPRGAWVLDLGAGEAELARVLKHARYVAVDTAVGHGAWDYSRLDVLADAAALPIRDRSFDVVVCKQVLEHVRDPIAVLREAARILRPGARILLSTNQAWPQHQKPHDFFRFTSYALRYCFEQAGLVISRIEPMGGAFTAALFHLSQTLTPAIWGRTDAGRRTAGVVLKPFGLLFRLLMPLVSLLDRLDRTKDSTLGWYVDARRP